MISGPVLGFNEQQWAQWVYSGGPRAGMGWHDPAPEEVKLMVRLEAGSGKGCFALIKRARTLHHHWRRSHANSCRIDDAILREEGRGLTSCSNTAEVGAENRPAVACASARAPPGSKCVRYGAQSASTEEGFRTERKNRERLVGSGIKP